MPIHYLTALPAPKWVIKKIDKMQRAFLWKGEEPENIKLGASLVNWQMVCRPKEMGGLGIINLERFASALSIKWLWMRWHDQSRPWDKMDLSCSDKDVQLFQACTEIHIGDGRKAIFWKNIWLNGLCPKDIALNLFKLAKRKSRNVNTELTNDGSLFQTNYKPWSYLWTRPAQRATEPSYFVGWHRRHNFMEKK